MEILRAESLSILAVGQVKIDMVGDRVVSLRESMGTERRN